jgi:hypothetical protein
LFSIQKLTLCHLAFLDGCELDESGDPLNRRWWSFLSTMSDNIIGIKERFADPKQSGCLMCLHFLEF